MFSSIGLSNRLNLIIISINLAILLIVAVLANASSTTALRNQAVERFDAKADAAFQSINNSLSDIDAYIDTIAETLESVESVDNTYLNTLFDADTSGLVYRISVLRPDGTVIGVTAETSDIATNVSQAGSDLIANDNFQAALATDDVTWFLEDNAIFEPDNQATILVASTYQHATGDGLVWVDILQSEFEAMVLNTLNQEGLTFETVDGYTLILDDSNKPIFSANLEFSVDDTSSTLPLFIDRLQDTRRSSAGLLEFNDPLKQNRSSIFSTMTFNSTGWTIITTLPESEMPALASNLFVPIFLVSVAGLLILMWVVNRFMRAAIVKPLVDLGRSATEIGEGNLRFIVFHQDKQDEIGNLANAMNSMRDRLRGTYGELERWSRTLEKRVEERTIQLADARSEAEKTAQQLQVVYDESLSVVNEAQLGPVLDAFINRILLLLDASYCAVWLLEDDRQYMRLVASNDVRRRKTTGQVLIDANQGLVGQAVSLDQTIIVDDYENYEYRIDLSDYYHDETPFSRGVCAPLKFGGFAVGAVVVGRSAESPPFDAEAERQLILFTNMVSPSVRNAQLFVELQSAVQEAERANEVKTRFLASVTHELRTPLNLVINNMDFMRVGTFGEVTDEQFSRLNQTVRSAEHLLYLINDLLDVSKIEAGEMQLFIQNHEVYTMLEDAIDNAYAVLDTYEDKADAVTLKFDIEDNLPEIPMDVRRVRQVLNNLLSNAIKFTDEGTVLLKVFKDDFGVHFSVYDTGIGIPKHEMSKLFAAFERTDAANTRAIEGTGLGLPISQYLIQQHGSEITVVSEENEGSTFAFVLPFASPHNVEADKSDTQEVKAIFASED